MIWSDNGAQEHQPFCVRHKMVGVFLFGLILTELYFWCIVDGCAVTKRFLLVANSGEFSYSTFSFTPLEITTDIIIIYLAHLLWFILILANEFLGEFLNRVKYATILLFLIPVAVFLSARGRPAYGWFYSDQTIF